MFNKLNKWYWWLTRDREVGYDFEADVVLTFSRQFPVNKTMVKRTMVIVSENTEAYQKYLAYCVKHDILDKEVNVCVRLVNNRSYYHNYKRAVEYLSADDKENDKGKE